MLQFFFRSDFIWTEIQYFIVFVVVIVYTQVGLPFGWLGKQEVDGNVTCGYRMQCWNEKPHTYTYTHKLFWENMQQLVAFEQVVPRIINSCICESFHWRMPFFEKEETPFATPH